MDSSNFLNALKTAFPLDDVYGLEIDFKKAAIEENFGDNYCRWASNIKSNLKWNEITTDMLIKKSYNFIYYLDIAGQVYYTPSFLYLTMKDWALSEKNNFSETTAYFLEEVCEPLWYTNKQKKLIVYFLKSQAITFKFSFGIGYGITSLGNGQFDCNTDEVNKLIKKFNGEEINKKEIFQICSQL